MDILEIARLLGLARRDLENAQFTADQALEDLDRDSPDGMAVDELIRLRMRQRRRNSQR